MGGREEADGGAVEVRGSANEKQGNETVAEPTDRPRFRLPISRSDAPTPLPAAD